MCSPLYVECIADEETGVVSTCSPNGLPEEQLFDAAGAFNLMTDLIKKLPITNTFVNMGMNVRSVGEIVAELETNNAAGPLFLEYVAQQSSISCTVTCQQETYCLAPTLAE